jgi:hypothetical protein
MPIKTFWNDELDGRVPHPNVVPFDVRVGFHGRMKPERWSRSGPRPLPVAPDPLCFAQG